MDKQTIVCATGQDSLNYVFTKFDELEVVDTITYKQDLISVCYEKNPSIVVVTDNLGGKEFLYKELMWSYIKYQYISFIFGHPFFFIYYFYIYYIIFIIS